MIEYRTLENIDINVIHKGFVEAFSDYIVKIDLPLWKFKRMIKRKGFSSKLSVGAFHNKKLVGFILNGYRKHEGKYTLYDLGTGVIPKYRKKGITTSLIKEVKLIMSKSNIHQYLLEVIQTNTAAYNLYSKQGFKIERELLCFSFKSSKVNPTIDRKVEHPKYLSDVEWSEAEVIWDVKPSWQNSIDSIQAEPEIYAYSVVRENNKIIGYGVIDKTLGNIVQIAVDKEYRRQGIGKYIAYDLINNTNSSVVDITNVDSRSNCTEKFLKDIGFESTVKQYEMLFLR